MSDSEVVSFRVDGVYLTKLEKYAKRNGTSLGKAARSFLVAHMEEQAIFDIGDELSRELRNVRAEVVQLHEEFRAAVKR